MEEPSQRPNIGFEQSNDDTEIDLSEIQNQFQEYNQNILTTLETDNDCNYLFLTIYFFFS